MKIFICEYCGTKHNFEKETVIRCIACGSPDLVAELIMKDNSDSWFIGPSGSFFKSINSIYISPTSGSTRHFPY